MVVDGNVVHVPGTARRKVAGAVRLLTGLMFCTKCGQPMRYKGGRSSSYACNGAPSCQGIIADRADQVVLVSAHMQKRMDTVLSGGDERSEIEGELEDLRSRRTLLVGQFGEGLIDEGDYTGVRVAEGRLHALSLPMFSGDVNQLLADGYEWENVNDHAGLRSLVHSIVKRVDVRPYNEALAETREAFPHWDRDRTFSKREMVTENRLKIHWLNEDYLIGDASDSVGRVSIPKRRG